MEIIVNDKTTVMETLEQFLESLYQRYDNLTQEEFTSLMYNVIVTYKRVLNKDPYSELALNIAKGCWKSKKVSFNQWKVMNSFVYRNRVRPQVKEFN